MRQFRIAIIIFAILITTGGIIFWGWSFYQKINKPVQSPLKAIPENTALLIKLNKPAVLWQDLYHRNMIWKEIASIPYISTLNSQIHKIDSLLKTNSKLYSILQKNPCYAAMVLTGRSAYGFLFLTSLPVMNGENDIVTLLEESYGNKLSIRKNQYGTADLVRVTFTGQADPLFFAVRDGVFMASYHPELVRKAIDQLSLNIPSIVNSGFLKVEATTGKKVDANIFVNYQRIHMFFAKLLQPDQTDEVRRISGFADWSGLDVILKKDELLINGYTTINDTGNNYLRIFSRQMPQKITITGILPENIATFKWIGFNDAETYYGNWFSFASQHEGYLDNYANVDSFEEENQVSLKDFFLPWIGTEICVANVINDRHDQKEDPYVVFKVKDQLLADSLLSSLSSLTGKKKNNQPYKNQLIHFVSIPDLIPSVFGNSCRNLNSGFYTRIGDYLIFGNTLLSLKNFIDHYFYGKVLSNDKRYMTLNDNLSENSNIFYYFNTNRNSSKLKSIFSDELNDLLEPALDTLKKFESLTLQLSNKEGIFYTNLYLRYNPASEASVPLQWQVSLDTLLLTAPQFVSSGIKHKFSLCVFDVSNHLYNIDSAGIIKWKIQIPGKPMGPLELVFIKHEETPYYLFNTDRMICLVNDSGKFVPGYPVPLPARATAALTVHQQGKNTDNRILLPLADNKIHSYSMDTRKIQVWMAPGLSEGIDQPVQFLESGKRELIFIKGKKGHVVIADLKGRIFHKPDPRITISLSNKFYSNKTNKKGAFFTTDPSGKILYFKDNWSTSTATFNMFSPAHKFLYEDINDDGKYEYIFFDKGKIYFYDRFYKLIYTYIFRREISVGPYLINLPEGTKRIGAVSATANEIYLFGQDGMIELEPGIRGNTPFSVGTFGIEDHLNLVAGSGKVIKNWRLPKH